MSGIFLKIVNMSISASWLVLAVVLLRMVLKKAPRWICILLWGFVAIRLICPFSLESKLSLIPSGETIVSGQQFDIQTGVPEVDALLVGQQASAPGNQAFPELTTLTALWIAGIAVLLTYTAVSYLLLRRKVITAVRLRDNIFQSENVDAPFVLGIFKPKAYLPFRMDEQNREFVIAHEETHIRRKDHWWKPLGFLLLTLHWFNPLVWVAYLLLCRDIELACDEKVIQKMDNENRADYSNALLFCSVNRPSVAVCPIAFGEVGVKTRIKAVMYYKKATLRILIAAGAICAVVAVCFLTNPAKNSRRFPISFPAETTVKICYDRWDVSYELTLSQEEADIVLSVLNGKRRSFDAPPACPFGREQAFIIDGCVFFLARDGCSTLWEEGTENYYDISQQEMEQLRDIFRTHSTKD